jgi:hypothetical protein
MRFLLLVTIFGILLSCNNQQQQKNAADADLQIRVPSGLDIYPAFQQADSVQVLFYKDPFGTDSLRYYRFFTYLAVADTNVLATIKQALAAPITGMEQKNCRSEGKIYLLRGDEIVKTVYFNLQPGNCNHLYFIKDGNFYYLPVSDTLTHMLRQLKLQAKEPPSELKNPE